MVSNVPNFRNWPRLCKNRSDAVRWLADLSLGEQKHYPLCMASMSLSVPRRLMTRLKSHHLASPPLLQGTNMNRSTHPLGPKRALSSPDVHRIRPYLDLNKMDRDLALFDLALDSKLRACDLVKLRVSNVMRDNEVLSRARIIQKKTGKPVRFEITGMTRRSLRHHIEKSGLEISSYIFPSRIKDQQHLSTRQYSNLLKTWVGSVGLDGTHSMRRTKASIIYSRTKNIRAVQILLGHTKLDNTIRYLGIDEEDALTLAESTEI